jgi:hypothetical protein
MLPSDTAAAVWVAALLAPARLGPAIVERAVVERAVLGLAVLASPVTPRLWPRSIATFLAAFDCNVLSIIVVFVDHDVSLIVRQHDDLGTDSDAIVEVDHVGVAHADAAARHLRAARGGIVGAVDAIIGVAKIERAGAKRVAGPPPTHRGKYG